MSEMTISEATKVFASPSYANDEYFHRACDLLRAEQPKVWVEAEDVYPFWAITAEWFLPKSMARLDGRFAELAQTSVAKMESLGGRMEIKALLSVVVPRIESIALNGTPELTQSTFVSGLKRLPVNYTLRP